MEKYCVISCQVLWREFSHFAALSPNAYRLMFIKQGLHNTPDLLRETLQATIDKIDEPFSAVLLGYGLCSNGIAGIRAHNTKLVVPRAHDCITFLLGSKERYREYFDSHPGTYWYSPGWIETDTQPGRERYERLHKQYVEKYGAENADYLMEMEQGWFKNYSNAAYVDLGFGDTNAHKAYTRQCAEWLKWRYDDLPGDAGLMTRLLNGPWNPEDFLIVNPGEMVTATHDNGILGVAPAISAE